MADETRATFAPVHRPQPPQIVKSCLHPSRNFNSLRRIVSSFSFFRRETLDHYHLSSPAKFSFLKVDDTRPYHPLFSLKRRKAYSWFILAAIFFVAEILSRSNDRPKFCRLIEKFRAFNPTSWPTVIITLVPPIPRPYVRIEARIPYRGRDTFPRSISPNHGIEQSLINFNSPFCSG